MAAIFSCPACRQTISAEVSAGTLVQCPLCQQLITVPEAPGPVGAGESPPGSPFGMPDAPGGPPAPMPGGYAMPGQIMRPRVPATQGLAIAALVCGILGLGCLPVGLVGMVLGIVALVRVKGNPQRYGGKGLAIGGIATGATGLLLILPLSRILRPALKAAREEGQRVQCAVNLRQIGMALLQYAGDNQDMFPEPEADWRGRLTKMPGSSPSMIFQCPCDTRTSFSSYGYVPGCDLRRSRSPSTQIIAYDHPLNHGGKGGNILYLDGHVTWVPSPRFEQAISSITLPDGTPYVPHKDAATEDEQEEEGDG